MKRTFVLLVACWLGTAGCAVCRNSATAEILDAAKPARHLDRFDERTGAEPADAPAPEPQTDVARHRNGEAGHPAYYLLLPITVPFDTVTFPCQALLYYGLFKGMH